MSSCRRKKKRKLTTQPGISCAFVQESLSTPSEGEWISGWWSPGVKKEKWRRQINQQQDCDSKQFNIYWDSWDDWWEAFDMLPIVERQELHFFGCWARIRKWKWIQRRHQVNLSIHDICSFFLPSVLDEESVDPKVLVQKEIYQIQK